MFYLGNLELKLGLMVIRGGVFGFFYYMSFLLSFFVDFSFQFYFRAVESETVRVSSGVL